MHNYQSDNAGRIIIEWDPVVYKVEKIRETKQVIHVNICRIDLNCTFKASIVYASNINLERQDLWDDLSRFDSVNCPRIVAGDLDNVLFSYERKGGEPVHPNERHLYLNVFQIQGWWT